MQLEKFLLAVGDSRCVKGPLPGSGATPAQTDSSGDNNSTHSSSPRTAAAAWQEPSANNITSKGNVGGEVVGGDGAVPVPGSPPRRLHAEEMQSNSSDSVDQGVGVSSSDTRGSQGSRSAESPDTENSSGGRRAGWNCKKLGAGVNYRLPQPLNDRRVRYWRDGAKVAAPYVLDARALAGIVIGAAVAGGLASVGLLMLAKALRVNGGFRRQSRNGDLLGRARRDSEVETTWLRSTPLAGIA